MPFKSARSRVLHVVVVVCLVAVTAAQRQRLNPVIQLLEQHKPVFGLYAPSNGGGRRGGDPSASSGQAPVLKTPIELAKDAVAYKSADYLFNGSMEGGLDRGFPAFTDF